ncbi:MAG: nucleotidyltransferase substrate binding protein [Mariprofundaceae bacterium]|nr:nucleotidyltransferase substrate binding protein [Mariprofundaceae bacterium]
MIQALDLTPLQKALKSLLFAIERTEREAEDDMLRDSVIQRFEYTYELCWKMLKRRLEMDAPSAEAIDAMSYREMIREGAERGLIDEPVVWFDYRQKRNLTTHTYNANVAQEVYQSAVAFANHAQKLLSALEQRNNDEA